MTLFNDQLMTFQGMIVPGVHSKSWPHPYHHNFTNYPIKGDFCSKKESNYIETSKKDPNLFMSGLQKVELSSRQFLFDSMEIFGYPLISIVRVVTLAKRVMVHEL